MPQVDADGELAIVDDDEDNQGNELLMYAFSLWEPTAILGEVCRVGGADVLALVEEGPGPLRGVLFRPSGIGMLIGAAVGSIVFAAPMIKSAIQSMQKAAKDASGSGGVLLPGPVSPGLNPFLTIPGFIQRPMTRTNQGGRGPNSRVSYTRTHLARWLKF